MDDCPKPVTVTCPNHHDMLVKGLWNFVQTNHFVDFNLHWAGQSIRAHQLIVEVFLSPEKAGSVGAALKRETGPNPGAQRIGPNSILEFIYNGSVTVSSDLLDDLLEVATELDFQMLVDAAQMARQGRDEPVSEIKTRGAVRRQRRVNEAGVAKTEVIAKRDRTKRARIEPDVLDAKKFSPRNTRKRVATATSRKRNRKLASLSDGSAEECCEGNEDNTCKTDVSVYPEGDSCENGSSSETEGTVADNSKNSKSVVRRTKAGVRRKASAKPRKTTAAKKSKSAALGKDVPIYECEHCEYKTRNKAWLPIHMSKHDKSIAVFRCGSCYRQYLTEEALQHHKDVAHAGDPEVFQCPHCDYKARNKNWYQVHLAKHDSSVEIFRCDLCDKPFFSQDSVERHKANHKQYKCPQCPFETPKALSYYQHRFTVHEVDGKGRPLVKLNCPECKFTCKKRSELKYHVLAMHSGTKPFQCPQCPYVTGRKSEVNRHVKVAHLGLKPHLCDTCGFRTVSQSALDLHQRSHTGEKPYKCDTCGQLFGQASKLTKHARRHISDERPYVCHVCGSAFNRRYHLKVHLKNVHKIVPDLI